MIMFEGEDYLKMRLRRSSLGLTLIEKNKEEFMNFEEVV